MLTNKDIQEITQMIRTDMDFLRVFNCRCCGLCVSNWEDEQRCVISTLKQGHQVNCRGFNSIIKNIVDGKIDYTEDMNELVWRCATCFLCVERCSEHIDPVNYIHKLRVEMVERGMAPDSFAEVFKSIEKDGNVWNGARNSRMDWAKGLNCPTVEENPGFEYLLFVGDASAYNPRNQKTARAFVELLNAAGVNFAVLGNEEQTSGNEVYRMGEEGLYEDIALENIEKFKEYGVKKIVCLSPHGYDIIKNEYPKLDPELKIKVVHAVELLRRLIKSKKLVLTKEVNKKVTYHDPCYLGRHNDLYAYPRDILRMIPGVELVEMAFTEKIAVCCGGGGGGIFLRRAEGIPVEGIRYKQAKETGADVLCVACPMCMQMFEGENETSENPMEIKDIIELVYEAL